MPGGRLTYHDREQIAKGLIDGLTYAEIARGIQRPTSTVSREVLRNGGESHYQPDQADRATSERARRVKAAPSGVASHAGGARAEVRDFQQQFTAMMMQTGLPRMPARVLVCLLTTDSTSLSAGELVQQLQVSAASISKAVGYLEQLGILRRERDAARRRERYVVDDDIWFHAASRVVQICELWAAAARQGADVMGTSPAGIRLNEMGTFFGQLRHDLAETVERRIPSGDLEA